MMSWRRACEINGHQRNGEKKNLLDYLLHSQMYCAKEYLQIQISSANLIGSHPTTKAMSYGLANEEVAHKIVL
ncbi:hypothetical protein NPIL_235131 [Nephila pilipes]|uniref:Uncharacterized protein n=1 Tax=Nephila pilipes TaxID=299642 RepID=A0A8X6M7T8_NEPPI|nr:hypothetical protein NPIL_235131 [Nephila pilipes]